MTILGINVTNMVFRLFNCYSEKLRLNLNYVKLVKKLKRTLVDKDPKFKYRVRSGTYNEVSKMK